ncbi:MAG: RpoL/Rpb11 RNA polymerase subunit family protein [Nanopusillaceae archaeon]
MEIIIVKERNDYLELMVRDVGVSLIAALSEVAQKNEEVEYAGYRIEHPLKSDIRFIIKTKGKNLTARNILEESIKKMKEILNEISSLSEELEKGK